MAGYRQPYTVDEDKGILRFIIEGNYGTNVKGNTLWKKMECDAETNKYNRTWASLKNRFLKTIVQDLGRPEYGLDAEERSVLRIQIGSVTPWARQLNPILTKENKGKKKLNGKEVNTKEKKSAKPEASTKTKEEAEEEERRFYSLDIQWSDESDSTGDS